MALHPVIRADRRRPGRAVGSREPDHRIGARCRRSPRRAPVDIRRHDRAGRRIRSCADRCSRDRRGPPRSAPASCPARARRRCPERAPRAGGIFPRSGCDTDRWQRASHRGASLPAPASRNADWKRPDCCPRSGSGGCSRIARRPSPSPRRPSRSSRPCRRSRRWSGRAATHRAGERSDDPSSRIAGAPSFPHRSTGRSPAVLRPRRRWRRISPAIVSSASSHVMRSKRPSPFFPTRRIGCSTRSGE